MEKRGKRDGLSSNCDGEPRSRKGRGETSSSQGLRPLLLHRGLKLKMSPGMNREEPGGDGRVAASLPSLHGCH